MLLLTNSSSSLFVISKQELPLPSLPVSPLSPRSSLFSSSAKELAAKQGRASTTRKSGKCLLSHDLGISILVLHPGCTSPTSTTTTWTSTADFLTTLTLARRSCSGKLLTSPGSSKSSSISKSHRKKSSIFPEKRGEPSTKTWSGASLLLRAALARLSSS